MTYCSNIETMNVERIRYTQDTISDQFSNGASLQHTISMLKKNEIKPNDIPFIRVGKYNGHYTTIDNRRLYCFKSANVKKIKVKYIPSMAGLEEFRNKNTSKNGGISVIVRTESRFKKKARKPNVFHCDLCDINMTSGNKQSHLNGRKHRANVTAHSNVDPLFHCNICDTNMNSRDKEWHLNGRKHQNALKNINTRLFRICARKPVHKVVNVKNKKAAKTRKNDHNGNVSAASIANKIQIKSQTDKIMDTKNKKDTIVKVGKANVTAHPNENVSDVKHKNIAIPPSKSLTRHTAHSTDLIELKRRILQVNALNAKLKKKEGQINEYEIKLKETEELYLMELKRRILQAHAMNTKLKEKERQINEYEIKTKEMEKLSQITISIDDELNEEQTSEQIINPTLIGKTVCCIFSLGALYMCVKKYTYA